MVLPPSSTYSLFHEKLALLYICTICICQLYFNKAGEWGGKRALLPRAESHLVRALANEEWTSKEPEEKYFQDARVTEASVYQRLLISDQVTTSSTHPALG